MEQARASVVDVERTLGGRREQALAPGPKPVPDVARLTERATLFPISFGADLVQGFGRGEIE